MPLSKDLPSGSGFSEDERRRKKRASVFAVEDSLDVYSIDRVDVFCTRLKIVVLSIRGSLYRQRNLGASLLRERRGKDQSEIRSKA